MFLSSFVMMNLFFFESAQSTRYVLLEPRKSETLGVQAIKIVTKVETGEQHLDDYFCALRASMGNDVYRSYARPFMDCTRTR